jgi:hypothetical protein
MKDKTVANKKRKSAQKQQKDIREMYRKEGKTERGIKESGDGEAAGR